MKEYKISAVIVTYNRKHLLRRCINAISAQRYKPFDVYVVDNASTDGTREMIADLGYDNHVQDGILWHYIPMDKNEGGAGGFYRGMRAAMGNSCPDAIWLMDDDGQPDENCLCSLLPYLEAVDYVAPIVLSDVDHDHCSFAPDHESLDDFYSKMGGHDGVIDDWASPFNGILLSSRLVESVGFPKREMFIWGDEVNYHERAKKAGFIPKTIMCAKHYHPLNRQSEICYRWGNVMDAPQDWKIYCFLRNRFYNNLVLNKNKFRFLLRNIRLALLYILYYLEKKEWNKVKVVLFAFWDSLSNNFSRLGSFLN